MTLAPMLTALLAELPAAEQLEFQSLLAALYKVRYTGQITLHTYNGVLKQVDLGAPVRLSIVEGLDKAARGTSG